MYKNIYKLRSVENFIKVHENSSKFCTFSPQYFSSIGWLSVVQQHALSKNKQNLYSRQQMRETV